MLTDIPQPIQDAFQQAATKYSLSPATTDAGRVLRFIARVIPVQTLMKLIAHKLG